jgi:Chalcone isomerase-like
MLNLHRQPAIYLIATYILFTWTSSVFSAQNGALIATQAASSITDTRPLGSTRLTMWGFQIYDATLWTAPGFDPNDYHQSDFALELNYLRSFSGDDIARRSIKEMRRIDSMSDAQASQWLAQMRQIFPDVGKGDRILGRHTPGTGATFSLNGKPIGEVRDTEFSRRFFGIWLHPKTSAPAMRRELLGLKATP